MSLLRTPCLALAVIGLALPAFAAGNDDLDPKVLVADINNCGQAQSGGASSGTVAFQALGGSMALEGAKNLCFGNTSISSVSVAAPGISLAAQGSSTPPAIVGQSGGGGGGGSSQSVVASLLSSSGGSGSSSSSSSAGSGGGTSPSFFGGGSGGGSNVGAPGPEAGAGLSFLIVAGAYALMRRRRARA